MQRHQTGKKDEQLTTISRPQPHSQACAASAALPSTKQSQQPSALHDAQPPLQPAVIHTPSTPVAVLAHSSSSSDLLLSIATMPSSSLCLGTLAYSTTLTVTNYQSYKEIHSQLVMLFLNKLRKVEQSTFQILKKDNEKTSLSLSSDWNFTYFHFYSSSFVIFYKKAVMLTLLVEPTRRPSAWFMALYCGVHFYSGQATLWRVQTFHLIYSDRRGSKHGTHIHTLYIHPS